VHTMRLHDAQVLHALLLLPPPFDPRVKFMTCPILLQQISIVGTFIRSMGILRFGRNFLFWCSPKILIPIIAMKLLLEGSDPAIFSTISLAILWLFACCNHFCKGYSNLFFF
jgi:hypothetical protein